MNLQEQINRIQEMMETLNEDSKKTKNKLETEIEELGIDFVVQSVGLETILKRLKTTPSELFQKYNYNPFEQLFTEQEFDNEVQDSIIFLNKEYFLKQMKTKSPEEILDYFIYNVIDGLHSKLIDFDVEDWIIPNTPELLKIIYGDRIMNKPGYKKLVFLAKNIK